MLSCQMPLNFNRFLFINFCFDQIVGVSWWQMSLDMFVGYKYADVVVESFSVVHFKKNKCRVAYR